MSISGIPSSTFSPYPLGAASNLYQQDFKQLGQDLKSGDLAAAQKDFSTLQQDLQSLGGPSTHHLHNHHRISTGSGTLTNQDSLLQGLTQVGQNLTSSNLAGAQQAYAILQQELQQFALGGGALSSQSSTLLAQPPVSLEA